MLKTYQAEFQETRPSFQEIHEPNTAWCVFTRKFLNTNKVQEKQEFIKVSRIPVSIIWTHPNKLSKRLLS